MFAGGALDTSSFDQTPPELEITRLQATGGEIRLSGKLQVMGLYSNEGLSGWAADLIPARPGP